VGEALEFGMVGLNTGAIAMEMAPFGGIKASGLAVKAGARGSRNIWKPRPSTGPA
jgi:succinate-semialdehyde dehydrogenase/glutarate-semialdehyde dehydrogenase